MHVWEGAGRIESADTVTGRGKKVVIISIPGCFTPTCHGNHVPPFLKQANKFAEKGYEVYVISQNDPFVMSGFRTAQGAKGEVHFATELDLGLSKALDATVDMSKMGFGIRGARYALVVDDLKIKSFEVSAHLAISACTPLTSRPIARSRARPVTCLFPRRRQCWANCESCKDGLCIEGKEKSTM